MTAAEQNRLNLAVRYALRVGCFHPVPEPPPGASTEAWVRWGAMRALHEAMAEAFREER